MGEVLSSSTGWGRSIHARSFDRSENIVEMQKTIRSIGGERGALAVGLRRSYGDSALNSGGLHLSSHQLQSVSMNPTSGVIRVGAGLSIASLETIALRAGYFPAVVPGTGFVTVGGAIAADIHGKSHHKTGAFSSMVMSMKVMYSDSSVRELQPTGPTSKHFWATVGGMGLTGIIVEAELQLSPVEGNHFNVHEKRSRDLNELLFDLKTADLEHDHTVAWIDLSGSYCGRGIVGMGDFAESFSKKFRNSPKQINFPLKPKGSLITPITVGAFNSMWFKKPLKSGTSSVRAFCHPLDGVNNWNRVYGEDGFLQYQFSIPDGEEEFLFTVLAKLRELKAASFLGVLKRFGASSPGYLSFPSPGWTLAVDLPVSIPNLERTLNEFDAELVNRKGRVYLVKDSRLRAEYLPAMYPRLNEWKEIRDEMDPQKLWNSDQARRLGLC